MKKYISLCIFLISVFLSVCSAVAENDRVIIYSSAEDYRNAYYLKRLEEQFPQYTIVIEYMSTGNQAAKLLAEGLKTECDISMDMEYGYFPMLEPYLASLSEYDYDQFSEDMVPASRKYMPSTRNGGSIIVNTQVLEREDLEKPTSYKDLLKKEYRDLISMPSPKASGTGYMFYKSLVNAMGEDEALDYFDELSENILQFTSSGSGPVNALLQKEVAIGFGMTSHAVTQINGGAPLKVVYFQEGSPFTLYGQSMIAGKEERPAVKEVFDFLVGTYSYELNEKFFPEQMFNDKVFTLENYPENIVYSDMSNNTIEEKDKLLDLWKH